MLMIPEIKSRKALRSDDRQNDHVGYLLLSRLTSLTRNGQTAQRFESFGGHKYKTLTAWVKAGLLIVLIRGTAG